MDVTFVQSTLPPLALGFFGLGTGYLIYGPKELAGWPKSRRDASLLRERQEATGLQSYREEVGVLEEEASLLDQPKERRERVAVDDRPPEPAALPQLADQHDDSVARSLGVWGIWMPGFCQLVTGIILLIGLSWFRVFAVDGGGPLAVSADYMAGIAFSAYGIHWFALGWNRYQGNDPRPNAGMSIAFMVISAAGATVFFKAADWPVGLLFLGLFAVYFSDFFASIGVKAGERALGLSHILTGVWLMYLTYATLVNFSLGYSWTL